MNHPIRIGAVAAVLLLAAGCSRSVSPYYSDNGGPPPLTPVPTGQVASNQLPPPPPPPPPSNNFGNPDPMVADAGVTADGGQGDLPAAPEQQNTQVASVNRPAVSRNSVLGAYKVTTDGGNCQIILSLTKWSGGYRAASRGCPGKVADVSAWDVSGSQVVLKDSSGSNVANLDSTGNARYEGRTNGGQNITLYR